MDGHPAASKQPSGSSTPSARGAAQSVPVDSMESTNRRPASPSGNGSGSQGDTPFGTTPTAAQADKVVPPGERKNKAPAYVTGVSNIRSFLRWLQEKTGGNGTAQMRDGSLVLVPDTADMGPFNMGPFIADIVSQFLTLPEEKQREVSALEKKATEKKKTTSAEASAKAKESGERLVGPTSRRQLAASQRYNPRSLCRHRLRPRTSLKAAKLMRTAEGGQAAGEIYGCGTFTI